MLKSDQKAVNHDSTNRGVTLRGGFGKRYYSPSVCTSAPSNNHNRNNCCNRQTSTRNGKWKKRTDWSHKQNMLDIIPLLLIFSSLSFLPCILLVTKLHQSPAHISASLEWNLIEFLERAINRMDRIDSTSGHGAALSIKSILVQTMPPRTGCSLTRIGLVTSNLLVAAMSFTSRLWRPIVVSRLVHTH